MIHLDPRTKIILLIITVIFSVYVPNGIFTSLWIAMITVLGVMLGRIKKTVRAAIIFAALMYIAVFLLPCLDGTIHTSLLVWLALMFKCYPGFMLASVVVGTTQISEFMAALAKWNIPKALVIPLAIMFRYFPTVKEDWGFIKDAMAIRGISASPICFLKNPGAVVDALYTPILVTASRAADELSASAISRGIENPGRRTSRLDIRFRPADIAWLFIFINALVSAIILNSGGVL
ncbi:MAG: energy-coupling factor transporter transmembrane protein EcfT [Lachnospiraceae bacterium]|nr:energy-coupling factor transporter transmembrane protein EcfT [Lachnospiraceae bacterium]